jgi:hypothetical protein
MLAVPAAAKPISYVGGAMLMQENDSNGHTVGIDYTITPRLAVAVHAQRMTRGANFTMIGPQLNALIKRWNLPNGQGNIFTMTGAGTAIDRGEMKPAAWASLLADYETQRIFASYEVKFMVAKDIERSVWQRARVGWSTHAANYEDIHPWQVDRHDAKHFGLHAASTQPSTVVTPLVRLIYKTFLIEGGVSTRGKVMFNWVQQF